MTKRILYGTKLSGHVWRVGLLMRALDLDYDLSLAPAEVRRADTFRHLNPFGEIPVLQDGDLTLADSNAILVYLAKQYDLKGTWFPEDPVLAARVQRWLSVAADDVFHGPSIARLIVQFGSEGDLFRAQVITHRLLQRMDAHLSEQSYLAGEGISIADLSCYSYVSRSEEGGVDTSPFLHVQKWFERIINRPNHFEIARLDPPKALFSAPNFQ